MNDNNEIAHIEKRSHRITNTVLGIVIMLVGAIWLADNFGFRFDLFDFDNWWALFIFIGAISPLSQAWTHYQQEGFSMRVARHLVTGSLIIAVALIMLLDFRHFWRWVPVFIIFGGLYVITSDKRD